jgi:hypothetical protein
MVELLLRQRRCVALHVSGIEGAVAGGADLDDDRGKQKHGPEAIDGAQ